MAVKDWSTSAASNTSVGGVNIGEGAARSDMNNMGRAIMAEAKAKFNENLSLTDYSTVSDALTGFTAAFAALDAGGNLSVPVGTWILTGTATFDGQRLNIHGQGQNTSTISFAPASADVALEYNNPDSGGLYQGSITGLGFTSSNSVNKTAIRLVNCANVEVSHIGIAGGGWLGTGSIGVETLGRQSLNMHHCEIVCARPLLFTQNTAFTSLNTDHYLVEHCELSSNLSTGASIEFANGVMHTNTTLRNLALTGGKYGVYWNDTTSVGASYALNIENMRTEQGADATGYSIYLATSGQSLQTLTIRNCVLDSARNGIYLRQARRVILDSVYFNQGVGQTALDMTFVAGSSLIMINCNLASASATVTLTSARCVRREQVAGIGFVEEWIYDAGFSSGAIASDAYHGGKPFSIANDAVVAIADNTFTGFVMVSTSEDVSAIYVLRGGTQTVAEVSDPDGFFTVTSGTGSAYNIYWDAGTSRYVIQNKRGSTQTVSVFRIGTTA